MRDLINNTDFKSKKIILTPSKKNSLSKKIKRLYIKLSRLVFLFLIMVILFFGGKYTIVSTASFCKGTTFHSWNDMMDSWNHFKEND